MSRCWTLVFAITAIGIVAGSASYAQEAAFKVEAVEEALPDTLAAPIKEALSSRASKITDSSGKTVLELWPRAAIPAKAKPAGASGAILFPFLEVGELMGVVRFPAESFDYRDQPIIEGVYTIRYGLQPVNGDHLGVSVNRDYGLLVMAEEDKALEPIPQEKLDESSAEAAASNHPAIFILLAAPEDKAEPAIVRDEAGDRTGVVIPLPLAIPGESQAVTFPMQFVFQGHGPL